MAGSWSYFTLMVIVFVVINLQGRTKTETVLQMPDVCYDACYTGMTRGQCDEKKDLKLSQIGMGDDVKGKPRWKVTLTNGCTCTFSQIVLSCRGFKTAEKIDPFVLSKSGDDCVVNGDQAMAPFSSFSFTYAWDDPFSFKIKSSHVGCSIDG